MLIDFLRTSLTAKMNIDQKIFAYREFFPAVDYSKNRKLSKISKMFRKKSASLLKKNIAKQFIRENVRKIFSKKTTIFFDNFLNHVLMLVEKFGRIENFMIID